jgi:hypothetical protein
MVFPVRDYMVTPSRLRCSKDFNDVYRRIYLKEQAHMFEGFVDIANFNFNFDFEIYHGPGVPTEILNDAGSNIPAYLQAMRKDTEQEVYDILDSNLNATLEALYEEDFALLNNPNPKWDRLHAEDPAANYAWIKANLVDYYKRYLHNASYAFAQYPSTKQNGLYEIRLQLDPKVSCSRNLAADLGQHGFTDGEIAELTGDGLLVQHLNVYANRPNCTDCPAKRKIYLDTDADLLDTNPQLWRKLRSVMTGNSPTLIYDENANAPTQFGQCFSENARLRVPENLTEGEQPIEAWPVRGVQQFTVVVEVEGLSE